MWCHADLHTSGDSPVMETGVADSDGRQTPAPLRDGPRFGGAGVTETLPTGAAVVLGVVGLELFCTLVALLHHSEDKVSACSQSQ